MEKIRRNEEARDASYEGIGEWYVLTHEIEEDPEMLRRCVSVIKHAIGLTNTSTRYHRHGKAFFKPLRNYYATTRGTVDYPAWKKLRFCGLATCDSADDRPYWQEQDMEEMLYYHVSPKGLEWLEKQMAADGETLYIHGSEKKRKDTPAH